MAQASLEPTPVGPDAGPTLNGRQCQAETCVIQRSTNELLVAYLRDHEHLKKLCSNDRAYVLIQGQTIIFIERHPISCVPNFLFSFERVAARARSCLADLAHKRGGNFHARTVSRPAKSVLHHYTREFWVDFQQFGEKAIRRI